MTEQAQGQPTPAVAETNQVTPQATPQATPQPTGLSQKDLNKAAGNARDEGKQVAISELLSELGLDSTDTLRTTVQEARAAEDAKSTQADKIARERDRVTGDRDKLKTELDSAYEHIATMTQEAALSAAFSGADINPQRLAAALRLVDMDDLDVDNDGKVTGLEEAIESVKAQVPEWFQGQLPPKRIAADATRNANGGDFEGSRIAFNDMLRQKIS